MTSAVQEVRELKNQIADLEKVLKTHVKETGNGGISTKSLEEFAHQAGSNVRHFIHDKRDQLTELGEDASSTIAKRPITSAAVAFGAGALVAALLRR